MKNLFSAKDRVDLAMVLLFIFFAWMGYFTIQDCRKIFDTSLQAVGNNPATQFAIMKEGYSIGITFFMLAGMTMLFIVLLPRLQNISLGSSGINISLTDLKSDLDAMKRIQNTSQEKSTEIGGGKSLNQEVIKDFKTKVNWSSNSSVQDLAHPDDPQKGKWGGKSAMNERLLNAEVKASDIANLFIVTLTVKSTNSHNPLKGFVRFHLHDTFRNHAPEIAVQDGKAILKLNMVYGAFTVGAEADNDATRLELDLAELQGIPKDFKDK